MVDGSGDVNPRVPVEIPAAVGLIRPFRSDSLSPTPHTCRGPPGGTERRAWTCETLGQLVRRRRAVKATPARPVTISAHVPGSGTVAGGATVMLLTKYV